MKLYVHDLSGHSHRARLTASFLGVDAENIAERLLAAEKKLP